MTDDDVTSNIDQMLMDAGFANGIKSDSVKKARKKFSDDMDFLGWLGVELLAVKGGAKRIVFDDYTIGFVPK